MWLRRMPTVPANILGTVRPMRMDLQMDLLSLKTLVGANGVEGWLGCRLIKCTRSNGRFGANTTAAASIAISTVNSEWKAWNAFQ